MFAKVKRLRENGKRMSDRAIGAAPAVEGELRVYGVSGAIVANLSAPNSQVADPLLPPLYEARLITMHHDGMLFKGEERPQGDAGPAYVQEWSVRLN